jgi:L-alanine-DL-glutamate epimerase-like enolase superfamily enzyme
MGEGAVTDVGPVSPLYPTMVLIRGNMDMTLRQIDLHLLGLPLRVPYHLAFGNVTAFDTIIVEMRDDQGQTGFGEATLLAAYGGETVEDAWVFCKARCDELAGLTAEAGKKHLERWLHDFPFSVSALTAAIEMLEGNAILAPEQETRVPILGAVATNDLSAIPGEVEKLLENGYRTLKVKVGFGLEPDLKRVQVIQDAVAGRALLRLDGNQGYSQQDACRFAAEVDPEGIELLEQPCDADDWEAAEAVARVSRVPMMLDESIFGIDDIDRAADLGIASFIKLKFLKMGGVDRLAAALRHIRARGMEPVLGNGVASDIACWMEACVAVKTIRNAGEFNGFLRPVDCLLTKPLQVEDGAIVLWPGFVPTPDSGRIAAMSVASHRASSGLVRATA